MTIDGKEVPIATVKQSTWDMVLLSMTTPESKPALGMRLMYDGHVLFPEGKVIKQQEQK